MAEDIRLGTWIYQPDAAFRRWIEQLEGLCSQLGQGL